MCILINYRLYDKRIVAVWFSFFNAGLFLPGSFSTGATHAELSICVFFRQHFIASTLQPARCGRALYYQWKRATENDPVYSGPVLVSKRTEIKVKAFGKDFIPSETVSTTFVADGKAIRRVQFSTPNESYAKSKENILYDNVGGMVNYRSGTWLGYDNDSVTLYIDLEKKETIHSVLINLLRMKIAGSFYQSSIQVYYFSDKHKTFLPAGKMKFVHHEPGPKQCIMQEIKPAQKIKTDRLKMVLLPLKKIPDWHPGKGNHGWLFIDEIKVY